MTEEQKFDVVDRIGKVEIRRYHPCVFADVEVDADYAQAGNIGFGPLVRYISANNIAMTAPVVQEPTAGGSWIVSFVMPDGMTLDSLPRPANTRVSLRQCPEFLAAALPFSGYTTEAKVAMKQRELLAVIEDSGMRVTGPLRIARFDPPWKPGFLRRNEVVFPVER